MAADDAAAVGSWWRRGLRSIRVRTTAVAVVVVAVALAAGGVTLVVLLRDSLTDQIRTTARLRAEDVAGVIEGGIAPEALAVDDEEDLVIQVLDATGRAVASSDNIEGEPALTSLAPGRSAEIDDLPVGDGPSFLIVAERADTPAGPYIVLVGRTTEIVEESTALVSAVLVIGLPILLLLVGATTWIVVGRTLAPVEGIRRQVDEITSAALHRRVPDVGSGDEVSRLAGTMNAMLDRLEGSQQRQRRFVSDASHELRSPVATIRQHAEVTVAHPDRTTAKDLAEVVLAEDLRLQRLVEDLLFLARADEHAVQIDAHDVDLDDIVFDEAARMRAVKPAITVDVSNVGGGRVHGDAGQLRRVVRNLCENASRHARSVVRLSLQQHDGRVALDVEDDGRGVSDDEREAVFERFVRLDEARARDDGGSGLGLAIVREIVVAHGGECVLASSALGGARVEVVLPSNID